MIEQFDSLFGEIVVAESDSVASHIASLDPVSGDVLVLQDDATCPPDVVDRAEALMAAVPDDWQIVYLQGCHANTSSFGPQVVNGEVLRCRYVRGTSAYVVRGSFRLELIERLRERDADSITGQHLAAMQKRGEVTAYCPWQFIIGQGSNYHILGYDVTKRLDKQLLILAQGESDGDTRKNDSSGDDRLGQGTGGDAGMAGSGREGVCEEDFSVDA